MRPHHHRPITAIAVVALGALCVLTSIPATIAFASVPAIRVVPLRLPPDAARRNAAGSNLIAIDCVRPGWCAADGAYNDPRGAFQTMVATEANGRWQRAVRLELPPNFGGELLSEVDSVACGAVEYCTAVGDYSASDQRSLGFVAQQTRGRWGRAREIEPPRGARHGYASLFQLDGVACTGPGTCVAVGGYMNHTGRLEPMAATETHDRWSRAVELNLPANASHTLSQQAFLNSIACQRNGSCTAVGNYVERSGNYAVMAISESGGRWRPTEIMLPKGVSPADESELSSVSCTGTGSCTAVGIDIDGGTAMAASESGGRWARAREVNSLPPNADTAQPDQLDSVSCVRPRNCVAVGNYTDKAGARRIWIVNESAGRWTRPSHVVMPPNTETGLFGDDSAIAVSCTASGYCAADGLYTTRSNITTAVVADFHRAG